MQGVKRKVVYVSLYEGIAIVVATLGAVILIVILRVIKRA